MRKEKQLMKEKLTIFFDLDNTLINRDIAYEKYLINFFEEQKKIEDWEKYKTQLLKVDNHGWISRDEFSLFMREFLQNDSFDIYQQKRLVAEFVNPISQEKRKYLNLLQEKYSLAILTNGGIQNQSMKIKNAGLDCFFQKECIFISQEIGAKKPWATIFKVAEQKMNTSGSNCLMVGDDYEKDIIGAQQVNWKTKQVINNQIFDVFEELLNDEY